MWSQQLPALTGAGFRCVAYDRRGHGRSDQPGCGYDLDTLADDLAEVIELTGRPTAALVDHSRLVIVEGAGHGLYASAADRYNQALLDFAVDCRPEPTTSAEL